MDPAPPESLSREFRVASAGAMQRLGRRLARAVLPGSVLFLEGPLGAGKTTLARGFLKALGVEGAIKSPSFTLLEPYCVAGRPVYHLDCYRIRSPEELEAVGVRECFTAQGIVLVEWPEHAGAALPAPDLELGIAIETARTRLVRVMARSSKGNAALAALKRN